MQKSKVLNVVSIVVFCFSSLIFAHNKADVSIEIVEDSKNETEESSPIDRKIFNYLKHYGYIGDVGDSIFQVAEDAQMKNGLKNFQRSFGLEPDGILDEATQNLIDSPRCGIADENPVFMSAERGPFHVWNKHNLSYAFDTFTDDMEIPIIRHATRKAFDMWSEVSPLDFYEIHNVSEADIRIGFYRDEHGCQYPFIDDMGGIAHAPNIYPNESHNYAMVHFDDSKHWVFLNVRKLEKDPKGRFYADFLDTMTHELGHALGIRHIPNDINAIMYPFYRLRTDSKHQYVHPRLSTSDVEAIRKIYGPRQSFDMPIPSTTVQSCLSTDDSIKLVMPQKSFENYTRYDLINSVHAEQNISFSEIQSAVFLLKAGFDRYSGARNICSKVVERMNEIYGAEWACIYANSDKFHDFLNFEKRVVFKLNREMFLVYKTHSVSHHAPPPSLHAYSKSDLLESIVAEKDMSLADKTDLTNMFMAAIWMNGTLNETLRGVTYNLNLKYGKEWGYAIMTKDSESSLIIPMERFAKFELDDVVIYIFKISGLTQSRRSFNSYSREEIKNSIHESTTSKEVANHTVYWLYDAFQKHPDHNSRICMMVTSQLDRFYHGNWGCSILYLDQPNLLYVDSQELIEFVFRNVVVQFFKIG